VLAVVDGKVKQQTVTLGARGEVLAGGLREAVVEVTDGVADGAVLLRGTVGLLRDGTPVNVAMASAASAAR